MNIQWNCCGALKFGQFPQLWSQNWCIFVCVDAACLGPTKCSPLSKWQWHFLHTCVVWWRKETKDPLAPEMRERLSLRGDKHLEEYHKEHTLLSYGPPLCRDSSGNIYIYIYIFLVLFAHVILDDLFYSEYHNLDILWVNIIALEF